MNPKCHICKRVLNDKDDPLSVDCGGDCWGCVGEMEADGGYEPSLLQIRKEFSQGLRSNWMPKPETSYEIDGESRIRIVVKLSRPLGEPWKNETFLLRVISKAHNRTIDEVTLSTNELGESLHDIDRSKYLDGSDIWYHIVRKDNDWGFPVKCLTKVAN
jgi:hypothetical protein